VVRHLTGLALPLLLCALLSTGPAFGQAVPSSLSLADALEIARQNNPGYLAVQNDVALADWEVRSAYGAWIPSANVSGSLGWQGQGEPILAGALSASQFGLSNLPDYYSSSYFAGLNWSLNGQTLFAPSQAKASRDATEARVTESQIAMEAEVTRLYLDVLRQAEGVTLAEQQFERALFNLRLAQAQADVGSATLLDVRQAEVQVGRSEVAILVAENARMTARLRLLEQIGVDPDQEVDLTTSFQLQEPAYDGDALFVEALELNPTLRALRESREASGVNVKIARSAYFPSLSLSAGISGFAREASDPSFLVAQAQAGVEAQIQQCQTTNELFSRLADPLPPQDCSRFSFTEQQRQQIISQNDQVPFDFTRSPPSATLSLSIPVFQGLSRQRNVEAARVQEEDIRLELRSQEISLRASVAAALGQVRTAFAAAEIEERNVALSDEQLRLARERYQIGDIPFVDLVEAETVKAEADRDLVAAVYAYHDAITSLEAALGRPLRDR
jgi:outer membrane protein